MTTAMTAFLQILTSFFLWRQNTPDQALPHELKAAGTVAAFLQAEAKGLGDSDFSAILEAVRG